MRLVITGLGLVSPLGVGRSAWERALQDPKGARASAFRTRSEVLAEDAKTHTAEVWGWDPKLHLGSKGHRSYDRLTKMLIAAAHYALEDAGIKSGGAFVALGSRDVGLCSATAYGSLDAITELNRVAELEDPRYINPTRFPNTVINAAAGYVSIWEELQGPNTTVVDGNCGALDAVLAAETHLRHRRGSAFLVGGGEVLSEPLHLALRRLGVVAGAPGEAGLEIGEGACYVVVESPEGAASRGGTALGMLCGYGTAFEPPASEALLVHLGADAVCRAIEGALSDAGLEAGHIDAVCAAHSGISAMDEAEAEGIARALGSEVCVAAPKRLHGETFGAAGAFATATALAWMRGAPVAPILRGRPPAAPRRILVVTAGFYGNVSAVVLCAPDAPQHAVEA